MRPIVGVLLFLMVVGLSVAPQMTQAQTKGPAVYSPAQAARGKMLYDENCLMCHAPDLSGSPMAPPLGRELFTGRRRGTFRQLFDYVQLNMPIFSPNGLSRQQNADILAYMLQTAGFPAGSSEVPVATEAQDAVKLAGQ